MEEKKRKKTDSASETSNVFVLLLLLELRTPCFSLCVCLRLPVFWDMNLLEKEKMFLENADGHISFWDSTMSVIRCRKI